MKKIITLTLGLLCLMCISCSKEELKDYSGTLWIGQNLSLYISDGGNSCVLETIDTVRTVKAVSPYTGKFEVRWTGESSFDLYPDPSTYNSDMLIKMYSGSIVRKNLILYDIQSSSGASYKLSRSYYD